LPAVEAALDRGAPHEAIALCEAALANDPDDVTAQRHLGSLLVATGNGRKALEACRRASALAPGDPRVWSDLGRVYALQERFAEAERCFRAAVSLDDRHADGWHNLGTTLRRLGRYEEAFEALKRALIIDPQRAGTYLNLGGLLIESQQFDDALECFERAARLDPSLARAQSRLAAHLAAGGKLRRAEDLFRRSISLDPAHLEGWLGLGQALEDIGDREAALGCYRNVLTRDSGHAAALGRYLALLRVSAPDALLAAASAAVDDSRRSHADRALIGYGLAKYQDRQGAFAEAAVAARAANAARRREAGSFDRGAFDARVAAIIENCNARFFAQRRGFGLGTDQPVFIVGLPRSGTTLTEQIIASHPLLHGAGELPDLPRLAARLSPDAPWKSAQCVAPATSRELAHEYLRALRDGAPKGRLRITDKSPFNFFQLGFAGLLFPQARVIHCRRNERDNALSIWLENFNHEQHYATDFGDLAHLRGGYERLMGHWREVLPLPILEVDYESLVADAETGARRIVEFLGAPWDRRCLDFHQSDRTVQTPSRWQVRQRIYTSSIGRWRSYAPHLPELEGVFP
jgi:tetratricopeptide (TPR) repeat protein